MKKQLALIVLTLFVSSFITAASLKAFGATDDNLSGAAGLKAKIATLETKIKAAKLKTVKAKLMKQLVALKVKLARMEMASMAPAVPAPRPAPVAPAPAPAPRAPPAVVAPRSPMVTAYSKKADWELDGNLGLVAGIFGANGALRYNIPESWFGSAGWSVEGGGGLATGTLSNKKTGKIGYLLGGIYYDLPREWTGGLETYVSASLNLPIAGSGTSGQIGGSFSYGVQTADPLGSGGKVYGEVGYTVLRGKSGSGISQKSVSALLGWRYPLGF